jgi:putative sigma-54 modulation protein
MNIELVARDVVVNEDVRVRVEQKLGKTLERSNKEIPVRMMVENTRGGYLAQVTMHVSGKEIIAQADQKNMLQAIDEALEKADRQFKKHHDKRVSHR